MLYALGILICYELPECLESLDYILWWWVPIDELLLFETTDWEAIADCSPDTLLSSQCSPGVSELSLEDTKAKTPKRRGRGTFSYKKKELYSDLLSDSSVGDEIEDQDVCHASERNTEKSHGKLLVFNNSKSCCQ